ncbi:hypothetical protein COEREDRAFT_89248 [Coemansia reversa NRRL 1564]|uniref:Uncharacterized protein n=1 Tax=Coemansia reversa (strain ATCC 12441 / NRRL 1564) TaxID=763665 RepID=A0A2G5B448_COERN|nr:hypothetical protein COEREDRAFT_89248 [Coemansia reversa NRRL 1564]|eukprot:PIA13823.1 hypothetical protein COEREDRAFT_89248 [Coemansia reversa NRRL 1564]
MNDYTIEIISQNNEILGSVQLKNLKPDQEKKIRECLKKVFNGSNIKTTIVNFGSRTFLGRINWKIKVFVSKNQETTDSSEIYAEDFETFGDDSDTLEDNSDTLEDNSDTLEDDPEAPEDDPEAPEDNPGASNADLEFLKNKESLEEAIRNAVEADLTIQTA